MGRSRSKSMEQMSFHLTEVKSLDSAQGIFEGYLAVFNNLDYNGDVCEPGCFKRTLDAAYEVKKATNAQFLFPLLFMHDEERPVGGFYDMSEDSHGLYVKGRCDLNTELGRMAFSGMQMGYMGQMSIGYNTIKSTRDAKGTRHLLEVRLWEGSVITTGYAANPDALVLSTKTRQERKNVGGKTSWPLAARDRAWDNDAAHGRIVAWATSDDGTLDQSKMKSVCFWYDGAAAENIGSYKLLFCDVVDGNVQAIPGAIQACTGAHGIQAMKGVSSDDMSGIKSRIKTYYNRMAKEFDDDSIVVPWEQKRQAFKDAITELKMSGLQTLTYGASMIDEMGDCIDSMLERIGDVCALNLDPDEGDEDMDVGDQMAASTIPGMAVHPSVATLLDNLTGLREALLKLGNTFQAFDNATDAVLDLLGMTPVDYSDYGYGMMSIRPPLNVKVSRSLSAANRATITKVVSGLQEHHAALQTMLDTNDADDGKRSNALPPLDRKQRHSEPRATTDPASPADSDPDDDTTRQLEELVGEMQLFTTLRSKPRGE